jgi:ribose/xylose/arabinose/galactoside ABC-type transport system permease subunit
MYMLTAITSNAALACVFFAGLSGLAGAGLSHYTSAGNSLAAIGVELDKIAAVVIGGTRFSGSQSSVLGLIETHLTLDGMLSSWRTEFVVGLLLLALTLLPRIPGDLSARRAAGARGSM